MELAPVAHQHDGQFDLEHLSYYVVPVDRENETYRDVVRREYDRPLIKTAGRRQLTNMAVNVAAETMAPFKDIWHLLRQRIDAPSDESE